MLRLRHKKKDVPRETFFKSHDLNHAPEMGLSYLQNRAICYI